MLASVGSTFAAIVVAVIAVLSFVVGYIIVPTRKRRREVDRLAEQLRVSTALRDQRIDERITRLLALSEAHERRIGRLERAARNSS
jgi:flagellar biosynthesis/type III secretory pathway M-ring protein FliF/YscJ